MLQDKYRNLVNEFSKLDIEDKKEEILNNLKELLDIFHNYNNDDLLPVLNDYEDDDEFLDMLFTYVISLKEENAKFIEKISSL